jgi:hypothetical protein
MNFQNLLETMSKNWKLLLLVLVILVVVYMCYYREDFSEKHHKHHSHHAHHAHHAKAEAEQKPAGVLASLVRIRFDPSKPVSGDDCIQVSQLAVYDQNGDNLALNRPVMYKSIHGAIPQSNYNISTDGNMNDRPFPQIYHDGTCGGTNSGEFWMIELEKPSYVTKVVYFNRQDCCQERATRLIVELLDDKQNVVSTKNLISSSMSEEVDFS